jgi:hypothetical protein
MKILKFSKYSFLNNAELLKEGSEFLQYQFGIEPFGTQGGGGQYAFAQDPTSSYYNYQDSPYTDFYARQAGLVSNLDIMMKNLRGQTDMIYKNQNTFLQDINEYKNLKILKIFENNNLKIDVFISFEYNDKEYFGKYKHFNGLANGSTKPILETELFYETEYQYIFDKEYKLKLGNYFYKKLKKWFIPEKGFYKNLKEGNHIKDNMGKLYEIKNNKTVEVLGYNLSPENNPYIVLKVDNKTYHIENNDYYYFKWRFEKLN